jgi:hypothetical protein
MKDAFQAGAAAVAAKTRRLTLGIVVVVALGVCSVALAAGGVVGTYATTIKSPAELKGKWVVTFSKSGSYTVALSGKPLARGTYSATARTITVREGADRGCGGSGTYAWNKSGKTLTFVRKRESASCKERAFVLAHRFTQVR